MSNTDEREEPSIMDTLAMLAAVIGVVWRAKGRPYLHRYAYGRDWHGRYDSFMRDMVTVKGAMHRGRNLRREFRFGIGNREPLRAARGVGYAERMSYMGKHTGEVFA